MLNILFIKLDAAQRFQGTFQDSATPIHEGLLNLYEDLMCLLVGILFFVLVILVFILYWYVEEGRAVNKIRFMPCNSHTLLEFIWTLIPGLLLIVLVMPTFSLLYAFDDALSTEFTLKVIGHQWYWSYAMDRTYLNPTQDGLVENTTSLIKNLNNMYTTSEEGTELATVFKMIFNNEKNTRWLNNSFSFDSYMVGEANLLKGQLRLLEVDNRLLLPKKTSIRALITSTDVLHSWAIPSFGVKMDACPGRLNQVSLFVNRSAVYYGQCSEICGINHAFMPICIEVH